MSNEILSNGEQYAKKNRFRRKWYRLMLALSSVVVFVITYAMILPAITMEQTESTPAVQEITEEITAEAPAADVADLEENTISEENDPQKEEEAPSDEAEKAPLTLGKGSIDPKNSSLKYKSPGDSDWKDFKQGAEIPGDASFQMNISFQKIDLETLIAAGGKINYRLPEIFRNAKCGENFEIGEETVGTITVDGLDIQMQFKLEWLKKQLESQGDQGEKTLSGSFTVEADVNLQELPGGGDYKIEDLDQTIRFEPDLLARYGKITLEKMQPKLIQDKTGDYLEYTITVTAGEDGCPGVVVKDQFTENKAYVVSYQVISPKETELEQDSDGNQVWNIGDMDPGTKKELTYRVQLKPECLGIARNGKITNNAELFSKGNEMEYPRDSKSQDFNLVAKTGLSKKYAEFTPTSDGGGTITYTIWVSADQGNTYTLDDVIIWDSLDKKIPTSDSYPSWTAEEARKYLSYDKESFRLYTGGQKNQNGVNGLQPADTQGKLELNQSGDDKNFRYHVGSLAPGESKTLVYTIKVDKGIYTVSNEAIHIKNRAMTLTEFQKDANTLERGWLERYATDKDIGSKKWTGKLSQGPTTEETTVSMGSEHFTVPAGSYQYQVVVNEAGDWDITSAVMTDTLDPSNLNYVGYLKIDAYKIPENQRSDSKTTAEAVEKLSKQTATKTGWIKIDGKQSFTLNAEDLKKAGLSESGEYAYLLTYYAKPVNMGGMSSAKVTNTFQLSGMVIKGEDRYLLGSNIKSETTVTVQGTNYFTAQKKFWYDDEAAADRSLYWILSIKGATIPKGTSFKDSIGTEAETHAIDEIAKAFIGSSSLDFSKMTDLDQLTGVRSFDAYQINRSSNSELEVILNEDVKPGEDNSLYFIIRTKPDPESLPTTKGSYKTYKNQLYTKDPGADSWVHQSEDSYNLFKNGHIYKEAAGTFTATSEQLAKEEVTYLSGSTIKEMAIQYDHLQKSGGGTYVAWSVTVNKAGDLSGRHRVVERIPAGMEVVYVQRYSYRGSEKTFVRQPELREQGYTEVTRVFQFPKYDLNPTPAYYYVKGQEVIWDVAGLQPGSDDQSVLFLVVCRLTDKDVLLGGEEKIFKNQVSLQDHQANICGADEAQVTLKAPTLEKTGSQPSSQSPIYQFTLTINPLGTDLISGSDTIKLIDEMPENLQFVDGSIKVHRAAEGEKGEELNEDQYTYAVEDRKLILTLPDDLALIVTYDATVNAAPGESVEFTNKAYWEGFRDAAVSKKEEHFSYIAPTVSVDTNPIVTITKKDMYDGKVALKDAEFALYETTLGDDGLSIEGEPVCTGSTDENGKLTFGQGDYKLNYNQVYRLIETSAPSGYVKDEEPHDFLIAKKENGQFPDYEQYQGQVTIYYQGAAYSYTAYNHKGEIQVKKQFADAAGKVLEGTQLSGTYRFGLFSRDAQGNIGNMLQTTEIVFRNGTVTPEGGTAKFTNVELGSVYVVYELDDEGNPISANTAGTVSGIPFVVSYSADTVIVTADHAAAEITVTNRMNYAELPASGGCGTIAYTIGGTAVSLAAAGMLCHRNRRKRRSESPFSIEK